MGLLLKLQPEKAQIRTCSSTGDYNKPNAETMVRIRPGPPKNSMGR